LNDGLHCVKHPLPIDPFIITKMLSTTKGIVLNYINYSETSVIAKVYTENYGLQSYIIKGIRKSKSSTKLSLLEHLSLIEIVAYHKENSSGIRTVKELKSIYRFQTIPFDIGKSSIALFINEILYKSLHEEEKNPTLFEFLLHAIQILDLIPDNYADFHLLFMVQYSKYLGFFPRSNYDEKNKFFNLTEGVFQSLQPLNAEYIEHPLSEIIYKMLSINFEDTAKLNLKKTERRILLDKMILFYRLHHAGFNKINSHLVLQEVLG
jgi:DNA repair protein RecO (recombination protein O)